MTCTGSCSWWQMCIVCLVEISDVVLCGSAHLHQLFWSHDMQFISSAPETSICMWRVDYQRAERKTSEIKPPKLSVRGPMCGGWLGQQGLVKVDGMHAQLLRPGPTLGMCSIRR
jgi:hypothetical protein